MTLFDAPFLARSRAARKGWRTRRRHIAAVAAHAKVLSVARTMRRALGLPDHPALGGQ